MFVSDLHLERNFGSHYLHHSYRVLPECKTLGIYQKEHIAFILQYEVMYFLRKMEK